MINSTDWDNSTDRTTDGLEKKSCIFHFIVDTIEAQRSSGSALDRNKKNGGNEIVDDGEVLELMEGERIKWMEQKKKKGGRSGKLLYNNKITFTLNIYRSRWICHVTASHEIF